MTIQDSSNSLQVDLIVRKRPMYLLKIGEELELPQVSRIALRQLVKANASVLFDENAESIINPRMWLHLMQLRMERSKFVSEVLIKFLLKTLEAGEASKNRHRRDCAVNDIIRSLIVYVGIMATQEPSWEKFEQVACSYGGCWGDCGSPIEVLRTTKPVLLWKEDGDGDGGTSNLYTDILPRIKDGISPVHIPASITVLEETARGANPALVPVYEDIKRTIQAKEAELPALPVHFSPPPGPHVRPTNPLAAF
ncbi:hypothetical protein FRC17_004325 [Serendipita sp. 399]|nr:hypothetical protein FRC17_004325 [Serendipita sp. 399]